MSASTSSSWGRWETLTPEKLNSGISYPAAGCVFNGNDSGYTLNKTVFNKNTLKVILGIDELTNCDWRPSRFDSGFPPTAQAAVLLDERQENLCRLCHVDSSVHWTNTKYKTGNVQRHLGLSYKITQLLNLGLIPVTKINELSISMHAYKVGTLLWIFSV